MLRFNRSGLTLAEMMVALALFGTVIALVGSLFANFTQHSNANQLMDRRNEAARALSRLCLEVSTSQAVLDPPPGSSTSRPQIVLQRFHPNVDWLATGGGSTEQVRFFVSGQGDLIRENLYESTTRQDGVASAVGLTAQWQPDGSLRVSLSFLDSTTITPLVSRTYPRLRR